MMLCNAAGLALIKSFEGCRLTAYLDQRGIPTIGWGATGADIIEGLSWTQDQADERFLNDLMTKAERPVNSFVYQPLTSNQFSALCSLCYNIGSHAFETSSALSTLNRGDLEDVPAHIAMWDECCGEPDKGLIRRRAAEIALWETP